MLADDNGRSFLTLPGMRAWRLIALACSLLAILLGSHSAQAQTVSAADNIEAVEVEGTTFRVTLTSGRVLQGPELAGATIFVSFLDAAQPRRIRLATIIPDPMDRQGEVLLYDMQLLDPTTGAATPLCEHDVDGKHWAFPLSGQWDGEGRRVSEKGFTLTCAADAQGKCVRFGYKPWETANGGVSLAEFHQACVRMVRADYCGNEGTTRNGMLIDLYDRLGIQRRAKTAGHDGLRFEAAWNTQGAVCVAHTRVPRNITIAGLAQTCPRLRGRIGKEVCTQIKAEAGQFGPALLFNRSK
jgi:ADYC domain